MKTYYKIVYTTTDNPIIIETNGMVCGNRMTGKVVRLPIGYEDRFTFKVGEIHNGWMTNECELMDDTELKVFGLSTPNTKYTVIYECAKSGETKLTHITCNPGEARIFFQTLNLGEVQYVLEGHPNLI